MGRFYFSRKFKNSFKCINVNEKLRKIHSKLLRDAEDKIEKSMSSRLPRSRGHGTPFVLTVPPPSQSRMVCGLPVTCVFVDFFPFFRILLTSLEIQILSSLLHRVTSIQNSPKTGTLSFPLEIQFFPCSGPSLLEKEIVKTSHDSK